MVRRYFPRYDNKGSPVAPERDYSSEAPEVDWISHAPPEHMPQQSLCITESSLIPSHDDNTNDEKDIALHGKPTPASSKSHHRGLSRRSWAIVLGFIVLLALGLGVGLGVGRSRSRASSSTSLPLPSLAHGVCNDSSFAAITTPDGTRHVFFQDINGTLRQAQLSMTTKTWATSLNFAIPYTTDARHNSPIEAIVLEDSSDDADLILILYISQTNRPAATIFNHQNSQSWQNASTFFNLSQYATAPGSRSIAVAQVPGTNTSSELSLWFENPNGGVTGLPGSHVSILPNFSPTILDPFWSWTDNTTALKAKMPNPGTAISAPFSVVPAIDYMNRTVPSVPLRDLAAFFFILNAPPEASVLAAEYSNGTWNTDTQGFLFPNTENSNHTTPVAPGTPFVDQAAVQASDLVHVIIGDLANYDNVFEDILWVNGSTLSYIGPIDVVPKPIQTPPTSIFPFARLAVTSVENSTAFYLYHQINETVIAEDVWDSSIQGWTSSTFSVATS